MRIYKTNERARLLGGASGAMFAFGVLYTPHTTRKTKTWRDGSLRSNLTGNRVRPTLSPSAPRPDASAVPPLLMPKIPPMPDRRSCATWTATSWTGTPR
jgi:hypothetical protein